MQLETRSETPERTRGLQASLGRILSIARWVGNTVTALPGGVSGRAVTMLKTCFWVSAISAGIGLTGVQVLEPHNLGGVGAAYMGAFGLGGVGFFGSWWYLLNAKADRKR